MSKNVFANGMEISAKKDANMSICAMADVCLSPPSPPAGPIPIPYPNTSEASKTSNGSTSVKIGGQEVGLKNSSDYKNSNGDEAATRGLGMGVVSHTIQGKSKHAAWSMDVKIEGANAIRHMDLTTHNHINQSNLAMTMNAAGMKPPLDSDLSCDELEIELKKAQRETDVKAQRTDEGLGTTITVGTYRAPSARRATLMKASSNQAIVKRSKRSGYSPSRPADQKRCNGDSAGGAQGGNHTEGKMIGDVMDNVKPMKGTLKMRIWHKGSEGRADRMPCGTCRKAICTAVECGLKIKLCASNGKEIDPPCSGGEPATSDPAAWT